LKNPTPKRDGGVVQRVGPEFKPQYCQKKKKSIVLTLAPGIPVSCFPGQIHLKGQLASVLDLVLSATSFSF
jgi:hypothetical protein